MRNSISCILVLLLAALPALAEIPPAGSSAAHSAGPGAPKIWDIVAMGAVPNSGQVITHILQKAIDSCHASGGVVQVPRGEFIIGTVRLRSRIKLMINEGGVLKGSPEMAAYASHPSSHAFGKPAQEHKSLLWADGDSAITIFGRGTIDGNGTSAAFAQAARAKETRPIMLRLISCRDITIRDIALRNAPFWVQQYVDCERLTLTGLRVHSFSQVNNDGLDLVGSRHVTIANCTIKSDDDGIVLKTLSDAPCKYVTISNCRIASNCNAIKLGTETRGDIQFVTVQQCVIEPTGIESETWKRQIGLAGLAVESVDGAAVSHITFAGIQISGVYAPFFIRLGNRATPYNAAQPKPVGSIEQVLFRQITASSARIPENIISGIPGHRISGIIFDDVTLTMPGGQPAAASIDLPEKEDGYPELTMFGRSTPASCFYVRHAANVTFSNLKIKLEKPDQRPPFIADDVQGMKLLNVKVEGAKPPLVTHRNSVIDQPSGSAPFEVRVVR